MKLKINLLMPLFLLGLLRANGQQFKGVVMERETKQPIEKVEIYLPEYGMLTETNSQGIFTFKDLPIKKTVIHFEKTGYEQRIDTLILRISSDTFYLDKAHVELEEFITSIPGGLLQKNNIVSVERISANQINSGNPISTADALKELNGVNIISTGNSIGKPVIRGLSGNRVVTYSQGIRIENQQWGDEHGVGIGLLGVGGIEVIKGPSSLLYGSDAIGGVLYFSDEKFAKQNTHEVYVKQSFQSNSLLWKSEFGTKINFGKLKFNVFGNIGQAMDYQLPSGSRVFNTRFNTKNIKTALGYQKKNWFTTLRYAYLENGFGITEPDSTISTEKNYKLQYPQQFVNEHRVSWENNLYVKNAKINAVFGYTNNQRKELEQKAGIAAMHLILQNYTWNLNYYSDQSKAFNYIIGSQGGIQFNNNYGEEIVIPDAMKTDGGVYTLLNYSAKRLRLQGGVRWDNRLINVKLTDNMPDSSAANNYSFSAVNYSFGAKYDLTEKWIIKINLSSGFRAPNLAELTAFGVHEGTNRFIIGNGNMQKEQAHQADFSVNWLSEHLHITVNPFVNYINNYIYLNYADSTFNGNFVYAYEQKDAILYGGETGLHWHPHNADWLHVQTKFNTVFAQYRAGGSLPLIPSTKVSNTLKAELKENKIKLHTIYLTHRYSFAQNRFGNNETATPAYQLLDFGIQWKEIFHQLDFNFIVKNIFNVNYIDNLSRFKPMNLSGPGINFAVQLQWNLL